MRVRRAACRSRIAFSFACSVKPATEITIPSVLSSLLIEVNYFCRQKKKFLPAEEEVVHVDQPKTSRGLSSVRMTNPRADQR
jgi:hypothetical protein